MPTKKKKSRRSTVRSQKRPVNSIPAPGYFEQRRQAEIAASTQLLNEERNHETEKIISVAGATSSELNFDFHDLPYAGLLYAARRFHLGHYKHGRFNWTQGTNQFAEERLKHMMAHAAKFATFRNREDLEAILCNAMMLADFNERGLLSRFPRNEFLLEGKKIKDVVERTRIHNGMGAVPQKQEGKPYIEDFLQEP